MGLGSQLSKPALKSYSTEDIPNFCEGDGRGHNEHLHICTVRGRHAWARIAAVYTWLLTGSLRRGLSIPRDCWLSIG